MKIAAAFVAAVVMVAGAGIWWFLRDDAPEAVNLDAATASVEETAADDGVVDGTAADGTVGDDSAADEGVVSSTDDGIEGTWSVDTATGDFDYESATGSFVGFRIEEELQGIGSTTAVGRTGDVTGTVAIDGTTVTTASFEVDLTTITTDDSRRDDNVQDALDIGEFPTATFVLSSSLDFGSAAAEGESVAVTATGDLTIHGVTRTIDMPLEAQLVGDTIVVIGSVDIVFADYDVEVPESQIIISVEDEGILELQLLLIR